MHAPTTASDPTISDSWMSRIHRQDIYAGFPADRFESDLQGWGSHSPIFEQVIQYLKPRVIIEVGTWKGASALHMASLLKRHGVAASQIVCVDTWLGSVEHWLARNSIQDFESLHPKWGMPTFYQQFLANVLHAGHQDVIVPFPTDSITAAKFLQAKEMAADAIYIDAGHDYENVIADLHAYWKLLRPGGIMFGDDYHLNWIGVVRAVHDFADKNALQLNLTFAEKWLLHKP